MERALQERIVGAIVLVVFIVLVVPVFLDGPSTELDTVSETVLLPGQNGQQRKRQTIVLERDRTEPVPQQPASNAASEDNAAAVTARPRPAAVEPAPAAVPEAAAPTATPAPAQQQQTSPASAVAPPSSTGMWAVQLGSFSRKENADRLARQLRDKGYAAFISQLDSSGKQLHRVRIGPQKDREAAQAVVTRLAQDGQQGQVVPHP